MSQHKPTFQEVILRLQNFWAGHGCTLLQPYDMEVGAGTFHTATFLRAIGPEPWNAAYVQPSRRPKDGRYGDNPNRLQHYYQYQVVLKPSPANIQDLYIESLRALGIDPMAHDIRFVEDDWESPTLGAWGLGWEVWPDGSKITYGDVYHQNEVEQSTYNFEHSNVEWLFRLFGEYEAEAKRLMAVPLVLPAFEMVMKCSHTFNLLDARGAISVTERAPYIGRVRSLA